VLVACVGCTSGGSTTAATTPAGATTTPAAAAAGGGPLQQDYVNTIRLVLPSVVEIKTASGLGSGVVYDTAGHIVTNAHVVGAATSFQVLLAGSASPLPARLTGSYPPDDLAVIQVTGAAHLVPARFADSSKLQVGDIVLAMGNPLGLASSVTDGIISAVGIMKDPYLPNGPWLTKPAQGHDPMAGELDVRARVRR
jgi:S1-C subfamily serine protease